MAEAGKFLKKFSYMKKERMSTGILPLDIVFWLMALVVVIFVLAVWRMVH